MNVVHKCLSRDFLLNIRDSVIQTQYFNGDVLRNCDTRLPSACLRPINYSALTASNRKLFETLPFRSHRMRCFFEARENRLFPTASHGPRGEITPRDSLVPALQCRPLTGVLLLRYSASSFRLRLNFQRLLRHQLGPASQLNPYLLLALRLCPQSA